MNRFGTLALLAASGVMAGSAGAATITWGAVTSAGPGVTSAAEIDNSFTVLEANSLGGGALTVNGIAFSDTGGNSGTFWTGEGNPSTGDADLDALLDSHVTSYGTPSHPTEYTLEFSGLSNGQVYQIQLIGIHDDRTAAGINTRTYTVGDGNGNFAGGPTLVRGDGGTVIGTFTADGTTQTLLITNTVAPGGNDPGLSGYVLSQVPEPGSLALLGLGGLMIARRRRG